MWTNKSGAAGSSGTSTLNEPSRPTPAGTHEYRPSAQAPRPLAWLGSGLTLKGELSGAEDVHIDCKLDGPVSLGGNRLTVGPGGKIQGEVVAREVVIEGKVSGEIRAHDRVEIHKEGSFIGDLVTSRISIEEGAYLKGAIEIDRDTKPVGADLQSLLARTETTVQE
ncbi:MAG: polymer-forming cytoskeletal protein [Candidatus Acidiferrales bacterium]